MPNKKNIDQLELIRDQLNQAQSVVVANYSGLNVTEQNELRVKLTQAGGQFLVVKNRLFKLAAQDKVKTNFEALDAVLNGQNAFLFGLEDAVSPLKALFEFAKDHESLEIKLSILGDKVLDFQETENLSKLPTKVELIAQLIARLNSPANGLVNVIQGPTRGLVYALNAIKDQKSQ